MATSIPVAGVAGLFSESGQEAGGTEFAGIVWNGGYYVSWGDFTRGEVLRIEARAR